VNAAPAHRARSVVVLALALLVTSVASVLVAGDAGAAFPGDNGKIVFFRQGDIYVIDPDGSDETNLTGESSGGAPAWSPDGTQIVYESLQDGNFEIYVMDADGSNQARLTENPAFDAHPSWSADGSQVLFQSTRDGNFEIYVMDADGSNQTRLTDNPAFDGGAVASPDGSAIAFTTNRDGNEEIYVMNTDGTGQTNLTNDPDGNSAPDWSPDGSQITYITTDAGGSDVWVMDADGSNPTNVTNSPGVNEATPAWSPDGTRITYTAPVEAGIAVFVIDADGSNPTRVTQSTAAERFPDWQPLVSELPPPGDLAVSIDDVVLTNGTRGRVTGTVTCAPGELFAVQLDLTQGDADAQGSARGSCTGSPQEYTIGFTTTGPAFVDGAAGACVVARTGMPGSRTVTDRTEVCDDLTVDVRNR